MKVYRHGVTFQKDVFNLGVKGKYYIEIFIDTGLTRKLNANRLKNRFVFPILNVKNFNRKERRFMHC